MSWCSFLHLFQMPYYSWPVSLVAVVPRLKLDWQICSRAALKHKFMHIIHQGQDIRQALGTCAQTTIHVRPCC